MTKRGSKPNKKGKHLQFYMDCMKNYCIMPSIGFSVIKGGLCRAASTGLISKSLLELFSDGFSEYSYWAHDTKDGDPHNNRHHFNHLRQTIVLLMACLNDEL